MAECPSCTIIPVEPVFATSGNDIRSWDDIEHAVIGENDEYGTLAFESVRAKRFFEHRIDVTN
jgi:hypothetical protein